MAKPVRLLPALLLAASAATQAGCLSAPEQCSGCFTPLGDGGPLITGEAARGGVSGTSSTGGLPGGTGGVSGTPGGGVSGTSGGVSGTSGGVSGTSGGVSGTSGGVSGTSGGVSGTSGGSGGSGMGGSGTGGGGTGGSVTAIDPDLVLWYRFDESSGMAAGDAAMFGGTARGATLTTMGNGGSATFSATKQVGTHAARLVPGASLPDDNGGYVRTSSLQTLAPQAVTIAIWVNLAANSATENWARIFDFGTGTGTAPNMYLAARAGDAPNTPVRFAITNSGHAATAEQRLDGPSTLTPNAWHHLAVVLAEGSPYSGVLYIDGTAVATNTTMTLHPADLGATTNNWLGRSQFSGNLGSNPCLNGWLDDFRVYRRALSAGEIAALFAVR